MQLTRWNYRYDFVSLMVSFSLVIDRYRVVAHRRGATSQRVEIKEKISISKKH